MHKGRRRITPVLLISISAQMDTCHALTTLKCLILPKLNTWCAGPLIRPPPITAQSLALPLTLMEYQLISNLSTPRFSYKEAVVLCQTAAFTTVKASFSKVLIIYACKAILPAKILSKLLSIPHRATSLQRWLSICLAVRKAIPLISICPLLLA